MSQEPVRLGRSRREVLRLVGLSGLPALGAACSSAPAPAPTLPPTAAQPAPTAVPPTTVPNPTAAQAAPTSAPAQAQPTSAEDWKGAFFPRFFQERQAGLYQRDLMLIPATDAIVQGVGQGAIDPRQAVQLRDHAQPIADAMDSTVVDLAFTELPCNWLQAQENSLDPVHTEWLLNYFGNYVADMTRDERRRPPRGGTFGRKHLKIAFDNFEYGIVKRRMVEGDTGEEEDWTLGHPVFFPNVLLMGSQYSYMMQFRTPVDDTHTFHVSVYIFPAAPGQQAPKQEFVPYRNVPLTDEDGNWIPNYTFNQDYMAWVAQGDIAQRDKEKLDASDRGIAPFRQMLQEQMERVREGEEPMNTFRDAEANRRLSFPMEKVKHQQRKWSTYQPGEAGFSADAELIEAALATWDHTEYAASISRLRR